MLRGCTVFVTGQFLQPDFFSEDTRYFSRHRRLDTWFPHPCLDGARQRVPLVLGQLCAGLAPLSLREGATPTGSSLAITGGVSGHRVQPDGKEGTVCSITVHGPLGDQC